MLDAVDLPDDIPALKALLTASQAREVRKDDRIDRLEKLVAAFKQVAFGRKFEKTDPEQFHFALEDLETAIAAVHAKDEADSLLGKPRPNHAPSIVVIFPPLTWCRRGHRAGRTDLPPVGVAYIA
jgi:hypothetical protein